MRVPLAPPKASGNRLEFEVRGDVVVITKAGTRRRGRRIVEALKGRGDVALSTDEIMALTRGGEW